MRWGSVLFLLLILLVSVPHALSGDGGQDDITVVLPGPALSKMVSALLPLPIDSDGRVSGDLSIQSVRNVQFDKDKVRCSVHFLGKEAKYNLPVQESTSVIINIGDIDIAFDLEGALRFDSKAGMLYVKPTIVGAVQGAPEGSPLRLLLAVLTAMEYPIDMNNLVPVTTGIEGRPVRVDLSISDISSEKDRLVLTMEPRVVKEHLRAMDKSS